jgi:hypothetical protein
MGIGNDFFNRTQMAQQLRERIDKWDYMKTKETVSKLSLPTEWEKIFASYIADKNVINRLYRGAPKTKHPQIQ